MNRLLTVDDLAELWQIPKSWIYEHTRTKKIPHRRVGKYIRFDPNEVSEWLDKLRSFSLEAKAKRRS